MPASIMVEGGGSGSDLDCFSDASKNHLLSRSTIPMFWESTLCLLYLPHIVQQPEGVTLPKYPQTRLLMILVEEVV